MTESPSSRAVEAPRRSSGSKLRFFFLAALVTLLIDVVTKALVVAHISPDATPIRLFGGAVYLVQARNSGAAFSVGTGATAALTVISLLVVMVILRAARRMTSTPWAVALGLVFGGALGNLVDRLLRSPGPGRGHVVDWISLFADDGHIWPIFNVADSAIVIGGVIAVLLSVLGINFSGSRTPREREDSEHPTDG